LDIILDVALLGTGGMMPLPYRFLTSLICRLNGKFLIIDCGEGTQVSLKMLGWGFKNIDVICFTHFHADHIAGLPGLLLTIGNSGREESINIIGPKGIENVVTSLCIIAQELPYSIIFTELDEEESGEIVINDFIISAYPMEHKIPCLGYSIDVKRKPKFLIEEAKKLDIPKNLWAKLQNNIEVLYKGKLYTGDMIMGKSRKGIKVCYCTDSRPPKGLEKFIFGADLFICEGLYGDDTKKDKAKLYMHMTFTEAAKIAKQGDVDELWLTHFSPSLVEPKEFLEEAKKIFENTVIGEDRMTKAIFFK
jgi:ribonuclease Z